jgi:PadR family transcriptional regulator PadR
MERKGLVRSQLGDPNEGRGGRPRRYVEVTEAGRAAAAESREAMLALWTGLDEALGR